MTIAWVDGIDRNAFQEFRAGKCLVKHQLSVARFSHSNEAIGTRMESVFHGIDGISNQRAHLVVQIELVAFFSVGIISQAKMEHQIEYGVVINHTHTREDFLAVAVPSAHQRLLVFESVNHFFVVIFH